MFSTLIFPTRPNEVRRQEVAIALHFQYVLGGRALAAVFR